ncbi:MAG: peptidoglycan DD-metalloendopeptidase family protein [Clostridia bacterium]|nr:peptidoglycan DD-metalloendopeptidase family protein [Clostridia bacterium]
MSKTMKSILILLFTVIYQIGRFIYKTGWVIESIFVKLFKIALLPLLRFLRKCTPKNIFNAICAVGEWIMRVTVWLYTHTIRLAVWAAHSIVTDFCYWAPVFSAIAVITLLVLFRNYTIALEVSIDDEVVSYVQNEQEFSGAVLSVEKNLAETLGENYTMYTAPQYKFVFVKKNKMADEENLYAQVYRAVTEEIGNHYGLYVDGTLIAAAEDRSTIETVLNELKAPYETGAENERIEFVSNVEVRTGLFSPGAMKSVEELRALFEGSTNPRYYTIEEDDYLSDIVEKTGVSRQMLYYLNPELDERRLIPGRKLLISTPDVYLGVKVVRTITYDEEIDYSTTRIKSEDLYVNQTKVKTAGKKGSKTITAEVTYVDGVKTATNIISSVVTKEPVTRELYVGTKAYPSSYSSLAGSGAFIRPINGGYTSCAYGGYRGHVGVDLTMSGAYGKPIYASAGGTVIQAGWSGGYGIMVKIRHSNGYETWYAHMSAKTVSVGDYVSQGQQIGRIGSTGNSTGPHLHFELRINGSPVNPMRYI